MSRPLKEGLDYFSHDCDLSNSEKIEIIETLFGNDGYAIYLKLLERIYKKGTKIDISMVETRLLLSRKCNVSVERFNEILKKMVEIGLFSSVDFNENILTSDEIKARADVVFDKRKYLHKWYKNKVSTVETELKVHKVKESKVKESKEKNKNKEDKSSLSPKPLTDLQKLVETYTTLFKQRFKEEAVVSNWGKIGKLFQSPLKTYGLEKLRGWLETYIFSDDEFIKKSGWRLEIFPSQINKMITDGRKKSWM